MDRRLRDDKQGVTIWTVLGVLLALVLLWQGLGMFLGLPTPYGLLTPSETDVWSGIKVIDLVSGQQFTFDTRTGNPDGDVNMVLGHSYDAVFMTNAPWRLSDPYRMAWRLDFYNTTSSNVETLQSEVTAMPISALWSDSFERDLAVDNYQIQYWLVFDVYHPDGTSPETHVVNFIPP